MRFTAGPALTGVAAILLSALLLPEMLPQNVGGRLAAQNDGAPAAARQPARDPTDEPIAVPADLHPIQLTTSESVEVKLQQPLKIRRLEGTLEEVLELISREMEVDIYPDWDGALADEQIDKDLPVNFELTYAIVSAETVLELLFEPLQLAYVVRDGFICLTTQIAIEEEEDFLEFRVYNVRDLLKRDTDTQEFMNLVRFVNNAHWEDDEGFGGNVQWYDGMLAVRQTQSVHRQIEDIFAKLSEADEEHAWGPERPEFKKAKQKVRKPPPSGGGGGGGGGGFF